MSVKNRCSLVVTGAMVMTTMSGCFLWPFSSGGDSEREIATDAASELRENHMAPKEALFRQAVEIHDEGDLEQAIQFYKQTLKLNKKHAPTHANLALAYMQMGERDDAIKSYKKAIEYGTQDEDATYNLGVLYMEKEKWGDAVKTFERAIGMYPDDQEIHTALGNALVKRKKYDEAIASYQAAIRINPKAAQPYYNLALANVKMKDVDISQVIENFKMYVKNAPGNAQDTGLVTGWIEQLGGTTDGME